MTKKCTDCRFCMLQDYGYSNYTVEGTYVYCLKEKHPDDGFDQWYGGDKRLDYAEECSEFVSGEPVWIDVDSEDRYPMSGGGPALSMGEAYGGGDTEISELINKHFGR